MQKKSWKTESKLHLDTVNLITQLKETQKNLFSQKH